MRVTCFCTPGTSDTHRKTRKFSYAMVLLLLSDCNQQLEHVYRCQRKWEISSVTEITAAVIQLLSEDWRTDRLTDLAKLRSANLNVITQTALQVTAAAVNHPEVPKLTTQSEWSLAFQKQNTACGKEGELDHSSQSYCKPCIYQLSNWAKINENKSFKM